MRRSLRPWLWIVCAPLVFVTGAPLLKQHLEYVAMHTIPDDLQEFDVNAPLPSCGLWKDTMPQHRDPAAYQLYLAARKIWRSKIEWQLTRNEAQSILRDVRVAADKGDWGARALMAYFYRSGLGPLESNHVLDPDVDKSVEIVRTAVAAGQAWAYYDLGVAHEYGYGGAAQDEKIAWAYYLRAAQLGSPEAQMALASAYLKAGRHDAEEAMIACAYKQEHGPAAYKLGMYARLRKNFSAELEYFQAGTRFGSKESAFAMSRLFSARKWSQRDKEDQAALKKLDIVPDPVRESRYDQISDALDLDPDLRLNRLDQVMPLPPAELPANWAVEDAIEPEKGDPPTY